MRLLNIYNLEFEEFDENDKRPYAITSHRWIKPEASYRDFAAHKSGSSHGYKKIAAFCKFAQDQNEKAKEQSDWQPCEWIWIDTCCIDETNSSEVGEAINSMFRWYQSARVCYAYLHDVRPLSAGREAVLSDLAQSEWFRRGWTLQELIAPGQVVFLASDWTVIGSVGSAVAWNGTADLSEHIEGITGIRREAFGDRGQWKLEPFSVTERASWMRNRETSKIEDMAYCLLGVLGVYMGLRYGERSNAWDRLKDKVLKKYGATLPLPAVLNKRNSYLRRDSSISPDPPATSWRIPSQGSPSTSTNTSPVQQDALLPPQTGAAQVIPPGSANSSPTQQNASPLFSTRARLDQNTDPSLIELGENLIWAAADGADSSVVSLLRSGARTDQRDINGLTALHFAALNGFELVASILIRQGADINAQSLNVGTPLCLAALRGHAHVVNLLLTHQAKVNEPGRWVGTPLHCASWIGSVAVVELLLRFRGDMTSQNAVSAEFLGQKGSVGSPFSPSADNLSRRASESEHQIFDCQPCVVAIYRRHEALVNLFVQHGFPVELTHRLWWTTHPDTVLFDDVIEDDRCANVTPLMAASFKGPRTILSMLLSKGAKTGERDSWGRFALWVAAQAGQLQCVQALVEAHADVNAIKSNSGKSALLVAVEAGHLEIVKYLAQEGADVGHADFGGTKPCHAAAANGGSNMLGVLLAHGAGYSAQDGNGSTPLHIAAARLGEDTSALECLLSHDANTLITDRGGRTALHYAAENGSSYAVQLLLERGADIRIRDSKGRTAFDLLPPEAHPTTRRRLSVGT